MKSTDDLARGGIIDDVCTANTDSTIRTVRPAGAVRRSPGKVYSPRELARLSLTGKRGSALFIVLLTMTILLTVVTAAYFITRNYGNNVIVKENRITSARNAEQLCNAVVDMFSDIPGNNDSNKSDLIKLIIQGVDYAAYITNRYNADNSSEINPYPDTTRKESGDTYGKSYLLLKSDKKPDMDASKDKNLEELDVSPLRIEGWLDVPPSVNNTYDEDFDLKYDIKIKFKVEPEKAPDGTDLVGVTGYAVFDIEVECVYKKQISTASRIFKAKKRNRFEGYKSALTATGTLGDKIDGVEYIGYRDSNLIAGVKPNSDGSLGSVLERTNSKVLVDKDREYFPWKLVQGSPFAPPPYDAGDSNTYRKLEFYPVNNLTPVTGEKVTGGSIGDDWNTYDRNHIGTDLFPQMLIRSDKDIYNLAGTSTVDSNSNLVEPAITYTYEEQPNPNYEPGSTTVTYDPPVRIPMSDYNTSAYNSNNGDIWNTLSDVYFILTMSAEGKLTQTDMYKWTDSGNPASAAGQYRQNGRILVYQKVNGTVEWSNTSLSIDNTGYGYDLTTGKPLGQYEPNTGRIWARFDLMKKIYKSGEEHVNNVGGNGEPEFITIQMPHISGSYSYNSDGQPSEIRNDDFYGVSIRKGTNDTDPGRTAQQIKDGFKIVSGSVKADNFSGTGTLTREKFRYSSLPTRSDMLGQELNYWTGTNNNLDPLIYNIEYKIPSNSDGTFNLDTSVFDFKVSYTEPSSPGPGSITVTETVDSDRYFKGGEELELKSNIKYTLNGEEVKQNDMVKIDTGEVFNGNPVYEYYIRTRFDRKVTDNTHLDHRLLYFANGENGFALLQSENNSSATGIPLSDPTYSETTSDVNPQTDSFGFPRRLPQYKNDSVLFIRYDADRYVKDGVIYGGINLFEPADNTFSAGKRYFVLIDTLDNPAGITYINLKDGNGDGVFNWFGNQGGTPLASSDKPSEAAQIMVLYTGEGEVVFNCDDGYQAEPNVSFMYYASMKDIWQRSGINQMRPSAWLAASWAGVGVEPFVSHTSGTDLVTLGSADAAKDGTFKISRPISTIIGNSDLWKTYWNPSWADVLSWVGNNINFVTNKAAPGTPGFAEGKDTAKISFDPALDYKGEPRCTTVDTYWKDVDGDTEKDAVASAQYINGFIYMPNYMFRYAERPTAISKFKYGNTVMNGGIVAAAFDIGDNNNFFYTTPGSYVSASLTGWGGFTDEWAELRDDVLSAAYGNITETAAAKARNKSNGGDWQNVSSSTFNVILKIADGSLTGTYYRKNNEHGSPIEINNYKIDKNNYELEHRDISMKERILVRSMWIGKSSMSPVSGDDYPDNRLEYAQKKINGNKVLRLLVFSQIEQIPKKEDEGVMVVY